MTTTSTGSRAWYESTGTERSDARQSEPRDAHAGMVETIPREISFAAVLGHLPLKQNQLVRAAHRALPVPPSLPVTT
jgi:hypothetical protein